MYNCLLCGSHQIQSFNHDSLKREWYYCKNCYLAFVDPKYQLNFYEQKIRYDFHQNQPTIGYIHYLNQIIEPTLPFLKLIPKSIGLDYGSGPGSEQNSSLLSEIIQQKTHHKMDCYDPIYNPYTLQTKNQKQYSFIFSTEVWEHFNDPYQSIKSINELAIPNGILSIMTTPWNFDINFKKWYYTRDKTHVVLYHSNTMDWIGNHWNWSILSHPIEKVWIFQK